MVACSFRIVSTEREGRDHCDDTIVKIDPGQFPKLFKTPGQPVKGRVTAIILHGSELLTRFSPHRNIGDHRTRLKIDPKQVNRGIADGLNIADAVYWIQGCTR